MFKELMPKNEVLGTILDTILITLGGIGGIAGLITFRWKTKYQAKIQAEMQAKADDLSQKLNEKITRRSKAYELRIAKEFDFYEKFGIYNNKILDAIRTAKNTIIKINTGISVDGKVIIEHLDKCFDVSDEYSSFIGEYANYIDEEVLSCTLGICTELNRLVECFNRLAETINTDKIEDFDEYVGDLPNQLFSEITIAHRLIRVNIDKYTNMD